MWYHLHLIPLSQGTSIPTVSWPAFDEGYALLQLAPQPGAAVGPPRPVIRISFRMGTFHVRINDDASCIRVQGVQQSCGVDHPLHQGYLLELGRGDNQPYSPATSCRVDLTTSDSSLPKFPGAYSFSAAAQPPPYAWSDDFGRALNDSSRYYSCKSSCPPLQPSAFDFGACVITTRSMLPRRPDAPCPIATSFNPPPSSLQAGSFVPSRPWHLHESDSASSPLTDSQASMPAMCAAPSVSGLGLSGSTLSTCTLEDAPPVSVPYGALVAVLRSRDPVNIPEAPEADALHNYHPVEQLAADDSMQSNDACLPSRIAASAHLGDSADDTPPSTLLDDDEYAISATLSTHPVESRLSPSAAHAIESAASDVTGIHVASESPVSTSVLTSVLEEKSAHIPATQPTMRRSQTAPKSRSRSRRSGRPAAQLRSGRFRARRETYEARISSATIAAARVGAAWIAARRDLLEGRISNARSPAPGYYGPIAADTAPPYLHGGSSGSTSTSKHFTMSPNFASLPSPAWQPQTQRLPLSSFSSTSTPSPPSFDAFGICLHPVPNIQASPVLFSPKFFGTHHTQHQPQSLAAMYSFSPAQGSPYHQSAVASPTISISVPSACVPPPFLPLSFTGRTVHFPFHDPRRSSLFGR
ncbi:hypothetical protein CF319_g3765 [Tilletia indica]|nr:hypothetical protein CF319_g3765 [Tilletia indica]